MQKSLIAIALALTLTSAFAAYNATNYITAPVSVAADNDTNFTNQTSLSLASFDNVNVFLYAGNLTLNISNASNSNWTLFYRQLNPTTLAATQNSTASVVAPAAVFFSNNYAIGFGVDNSTGNSNLYAYQTPLTSGTTTPARLQLSTNTNVNFTVVLVSISQIGNTVYVVYLAANNTANITSFTVGATAPGTPFILSTTFDTPYSLSLTWGQALGSSQLFAAWIENGTLKDAVINVANRTVAPPTIVSGYNSTLTPSVTAFATDGQLYGELTFATNSTSGLITYYVRTTANGTLVPIATYTTNTSTFAGFVPYGSYLAVFFRDSTPANSTNYAYEIWNLATFNTTSVLPRVQYLNIDSSSTQVPFRVASGAYYTLLYNNKLPANGTITNVQVGLLLASQNPVPSPNNSNNSNSTKGSSCLASVLGFLLTIVAGLFLF